MSTIKGVEDLGLFPSLGQPNVRITPDREQCGRYGLNVGDVDAVIQAAIGGRPSPKCTRASVGST